MFQCVHQRNVVQCVWWVEGVVMCAVVVKHPFYLVDKVVSQQYRHQERATMIV